MDRSQFYVEFKHGHGKKHTLVTYLIMSQQKQYIIMIFYHSKMYGALVQGIKQDDFKLLLEDNFDVLIIPISDIKGINIVWFLSLWKYHGALLQWEKKMFLDHIVWISVIKSTTLTRKMKIMPWKDSNLVECKLDFCLELNTDHWEKFQL